MYASYFLHKIAAPSIVPAQRRVKKIGKNLRNLSHTGSSTLAIQVRASITPTKTRTKDNWLNSKVAVSSSSDLEPRTQYKDRYTPQIPYLSGTRTGEEESEIPLANNPPKRQIDPRLSDLLVFRQRMFPTLLGRSFHQQQTTVGQQ